MTWLIDKVVAFVGLVVASPFMILAALMIKRSSPGPVLYRAKRAGRGGDAFDMYKLRTMHVGMEQAGRITSGRDPRVFAAGSLLRRFKLDEVPQLVNVVRGEMSLVGPRPEDVTIVREHYDAMMWESLRVPPGVTGPGALDYFADEGSLPDDPTEAERVYLEELLPRKIALDLVYVRDRSVAYYLELLLRTGLGVLGLHAWSRRRSEQEWLRASRILGEREAT